MRAWEALGRAEPRLGMREAGLLLACAWGLEDAKSVWLRGGEELPPDVRSRFASYIHRRAAGEPYAYIAGRAYFWSLPLAVGLGVLCPRPETEHLVEAVLRLDLSPGTVVADIGTGSGAIALALKSERPDLNLVATDISRAALSAARANAARLGLAVAFLWGDLLAPLRQRRITPAVIVMNPPYVAWHDARGVETAFEPPGALFGGPDGLRCYRRLADEASTLLPPGGYLALEIGEGQKEDVVRIISRRLGVAGVDVARDLAGRERVVTVRRRT